MAGSACFSSDHSDQVSGFCVVLGAGLEKAGERVFVLQEAQSQQVQVSESTASLQDHVTGTRWPPNSVFPGGHLLRVHGEFTAAQLLRIRSW